MKIHNNGIQFSKISEKLKSIHLTSNMYNDSVVPVKTESFSGVAAKRYFLIYFIYIDNTSFSHVIAQFS